MALAWILSPGSGVSVTAAMRDSTAIAKSTNACLIHASMVEPALILSATTNADVHGEHQVSSWTGCFLLNFFVNLYLHFFQDYILLT